MRTITFKKLLQRCVRSCGLDPERLDTLLSEPFAEWIQARLAKGYKKFPWPELCPVVERTLRPRWFVATVYIAGDVVAWDPTDAGTWTYYECQSGGAGVEPGVEGSEDFWEEVTDFLHEVDYEQAGEDEVLYDVLGVYKQHPHRVNAPQPISYRLTATGILVPDTAPGAVFIQYRKKKPQLTTVEYDEDEAYTPSDVFYVPSTGECYMPIEDSQGVSPVDAPDFFILQAIPEVLADYVVKAVRADWLADDGQDDKSFAQDRRSEDWIDDDICDVTVHQGQAGRYSATR